MSERCQRTLRILLGLGAVLATTVGTGWANPISIVPNTANMFRDTRGINNVGVGPGDVVQYGADIQGGSGGTNVGAFHVSGAVDAAAPCAPLTVNLRFCANGFGFNLNLLSGWTIRFTNGADVLNVSAPPLVGGDPVPFPVSVTISAGATPATPTISWIIPGGFVPDAFRINIFDVDAPSLPNGQKDVIHTVAVPAGSTSYTIPPTLSAGGSLDLDHHNYSINFQIIDLRPGFTEAQFLASNNNAMILRRSNSWFNFQPRDAGGPPNVHLPQVGVDPDPNDAFGAPYHFSIESVGPDSVTFIDPAVAVGYDYAIGAGDPNFASVMLPDVGDGVYDVIFGGTHHMVFAGEQFFFPQGGVAAFSVRGIELSAGLDPTNVLAFVTGLTFVESGHFTGTMTPIVVPAIADTCPCTSAPSAEPRAAWKAHGAYVSCVAHATEDLVLRGVLTEAEKDALVSAAGASTCGRKRP